jgi:hypothetical protein
MKRLKLLLLLLIALAVNQKIHATDTLYVNLSTLQATAFEINEHLNITFEGNMFNINSDNFNTQYSFSEIDLLTFVPHYPVNNETTSIGIANNDSNIAIFPNPAQNEISINSTFLIKNIKIFDTNGKLLLNQKLNSSNILLSVYAWKSGLYFMQISTERDSIIKKIIKQ